MTDPSKHELHVIGEYLETHTPQLQDPTLRDIILTSPSALLAMGFAFGIMMQAQAPRTAESILAAMPAHLREKEDAVNGLINAITAHRVAQRKDNPT